MTQQQLVQTVEQIVCDFGNSGRIFRNEQQLQFDLAWEIRKRTDLDVMFEVPFSGGTNINEYVDLIVLDGRNKFFAIELKYKTDAATINGLTLLRHSAGDLGCFDYLHDVERLEGLGAQTMRGVISTRTYCGGIALMLTNDPWYWKQTRKHSTTQYYEFNLINGRHIQSGLLSWNPKDPVAFQTQQPTRSKGITLQKSYTVNWKLYYRQGKNDFRYLLLDV